MQSAREPLSWLTLERYALNELSSEERAEVETRLAESESDRACLAEILSDQSELPALPPLTTNVTPISAARADKQRTRGRLAVFATLSAAAALLLVFLRDPARDASGPSAPEPSGIKGADVALRLISDHQGSAPLTFGAGERFKLEVTCPPKLSHKLRLLVRQGGELFEPVPRAATFACGNLVPWPGAFALEGSEPADVCIYWGAAEEPSEAELQREATCTKLRAR